MVRLSPAQYPAAQALYIRHEAFFPLIAAVLTCQQEGVVHADHQENPAQVFVEHAFGFAQIFGTPVPAFELALQRYLLVEKAFSCSKVRLYTPYWPGFLKTSECDGLRSWRQHFQLDIIRAGTVGRDTENFEKGLDLVHANASHVNLIEDAFGVVSLFWRAPDDFARLSNAVVALVDGQAAAICYAAAVAGGRAEIDVLTLPAYRHLGLGKLVVRRFNQRCLAQNILPLWDCFTNNIGSMALCESTGFAPLCEPYPFFTINR